jgi:membrane fusion protein (multidrug efflux system)
LIVASIVIVAIALSAIFYGKYRAKMEAAGKNAVAPAVEVTVTAVSKGDVPIIKEWVGTTQGDVNADIRAKVSGYLLKMNYKEGTVVKEGDLMFEIDPRSYQAAYDQSSGDLEKAKTSQKKSEDDVRRYGSLVREGAVSKKEYNDALRNNDMSKSAVASAQAALNQAQLNLGWTKVYSPITGLAGEASAQVGDLIDPSVKLTMISVTDPIKISFPISENEYLWHQKQHADDPVDAGPTEQPDITVILNDGSTYPEKGVFTFADRQVNPNTGTITVQVKVPNSKGFLRPGQYAKVRVQVGILKDSLVIPRRAIIETQGKPQVAVVGSDNKVEIRDIEPGYISDNKRVIKSGLKEGETIIVEGFLKVRQGTLVNPKKDPSVTQVDTATKDGATAEEEANADADTEDGVVSTTKYIEG